MRIAAVDIGTNTVLLLVAETTSSGSLLALAERATITRLGQGVDRSRALDPVAVARTLDCLDDYSRVLRDLGAERVAVVGTSAMRDAAGGDVLRARVREAFGVEARVLTGDEEARLTFRGALSGLEGYAGGDVAVFDIGGGSTEVVLGRMQQGDARLGYAASFDVGSVRLTERHVAHDPPMREEQDALTRAASAAFSRVPQLGTARVPVGVAGTMTTLAAVSLALEPYDGARVHGHVMRREALRSTIGRLAAVDLETRSRMRGMEPKRADVIVAGGSIALALLDHWNADEVQISDRGVRWGLAHDLALS